MNSTNNHDEQHGDQHGDHQKVNGASPSSAPTNGSAESHTSDDDGALRVGKCKWFNVLKGFGFITPDDGSDEVFVHQSVLKMPGFRSLEAGEVVEFRAKQSERGWEATQASGPEATDCKGSTVRPLGKKKHKKIRCFNCGQYGNHLAAKCKLGSVEKVCYHCKAIDHLIADCPERTSGQKHSENNNGQVLISSPTPHIMQDNGTANQTSAE